MNTEENETFTIKERSLVISFLLCVVTLTFYSFVWFYRVLKDSNIITAKKRTVMPIYWVMLSCYLLFIVCCLTIVMLFAFNGILIDNLFSPVLIFNLPIEEAKAIAVAVIVLSIIELISLFTYMILQLILVFLLAKNVDSNPAYYIIFTLFLGITIASVFAQDVINPYAGVYENGEQPKYYGK